MRLRTSPRKRLIPLHRPTLEMLETRNLLSHNPSVPPPDMVDDELGVRTFVSDLTTPTGMAFVSPTEFFVIEKNTGKVLHFENGEAPTTVLDLGVNFASERGLLSIALHPNFSTNPSIYLFWTCVADAPPEENPFEPTAISCTPDDFFVADSDDVLAVPLLGNRVDRFTWNATAETLTFAQNIAEMRVFQNDAAPTPPAQGDEGQPALGNHDGGVIRFGLDGKLYVIVGDVGRRGQLQNLPSGPTPTGLGPTVPDDQFGGPTPDNAHFTGVILRLNDDGTTPTDNPFFDVGAGMGGEVGANIQQIFAYGIRNSFGLTIDPFSGEVWYSENGDDAFDEINRAFAGHNSGWIQLMGPAERIDEFKQIELAIGGASLQQRRWPPTNIANSPDEALDRLFELPGSQYSDPEFSWRYAVPPTAMTFVRGNRLGNQLNRDLIVGNGAGQLMDFNLTSNRRRLNLQGNLSDLVDDNFAKFAPRQSRSLIIGTGFGIITDLQTNSGRMYVVSLEHGTIYEVFGIESRAFGARLSGAQEVPPRTTPARGQVELRLSDDGMELEFQIQVSRIRNVVAAHLHLGPAGQNGPIVASLYQAPPGGGRFDGVLVSGTIRAEDLEGPLEGHSLDDLIGAILDGEIYLNVHTNDGLAGDNTGPGDFAAGEIRGQLTVGGGN